MPTNTFRKIEMPKKYFKNIALTSCAALFLWSLSNSAHAQDLAMKSFDVAPGISTILPSEDLTLAPARKVENKLLIDSTVLTTFGYKGMTTEFTSFEMETVANPLDFLSVYAKAMNIEFRNGQVIRNANGITFGVGNLFVPSLPDQPFVVGLTFAGDRGYLVQAKTQSSAPLAKTVIKDLKLSGAALGELEAVKSVRIGTKTIETKEDFNITEISEGPMKGIIATNGATMDESSIIMVVKTNLSAGHDENRKVFEEELGSANLEFKPLRETASETIFLARSKADNTLLYMGFITSDGASSISLIVPTSERDPNAWLAGKYYYTKALVGLRE